MKKQLFTLFVCCFIGFSGFSQSRNSAYSMSKPKDYSHTIQTQLGYRWIDGSLGFYNFHSNLIPSYEFGYENKYFAKLRYITFSDKYSGNVYLVDYNSIVPVKNQRFNLFSLVLGYNFLGKDSKHLFKGGLDLGYGFDRVKYADTYVEYYSYYGLGVELFYKYFFTYNWGIGGEINYGYVFGKEIYKPTYGINFTISYRF